MPKLRIEFDKTNCIGAIACIAMDPKRWKEIPGENKVDLINGKETSKGFFVLEGNYKDEEIEDILTGARVCPVSVIGIKNLDTGEILFDRIKKQ
ncbi:MAG TPA: ferredoxin [Candidatus Nanoarchaeia archaeon]|nr:ferredoxin [Candidatus Nanoarchaeia archaeon]